MTTGIVIYCDAGARGEPGSKNNNPGHVGWGLHGYKYLLEEPKKGSGLPDQILTNRGYMLKSAFAAEKGKLPFEIKAEIKASFPEADLTNPSLQQITPLHYIDGYGSLTYITTNNVGELIAAIETLRWCKDHPEITQINILADSKYVVEGSNKYLETWKKNGWLRQDRMPIANQEIWKELDTLLQYYRDKNLPVIIDWVKAHNGEHGNEMADKHATIAVLKAIRKEHISCIEVTEPEGYWKCNVIRHPFITHKGMLFNTLRDYQIPGQYYLSDNTREVELLGKKSTDGAFAFVAINSADPMLEMVREHHTALANGSDTLIMARLDYLYNPTNYRDIDEFQTYAMFQKDPFQLDMYGLKNEPITRELRPAKLAIRAVEALTDLAERLDQYLQNDPRYVYTDITDIFFEKETVTKKKEVIEQFKLRPEIIVGLASVKTNAKYNINGTEKTKPLSLTLGVDLPGRNSIKHMEELKPKIHLITWKESDKSFRYATVITTDADKGIWAGVYSNLVVIND